MTLLEGYRALPGEPSRVPYGNGTLALRTTIAALRRKVDRRDAVIRLLCRALDDASSDLERMEVATHDLRALLTAVERDFQENSHG